MVAKKNTKDYVFVQAEFPKRKDQEFDSFSILDITKEVSQPNSRYHYFLPTYLASFVRLSFQGDLFLGVDHFGLRAPIQTLYKSTNSSVTNFTVSLEDIPCKYEGMLCDFVKINGAEDTYLTNFYNSPA